MAQYDDLNTRQIWVVGIVSAALTAVTILAVQVLYYALLERHNEVNLAEGEYTRSEAYLQNQEAELASYGRDTETGDVRIPIERAMRLVVQRSAQAATAEPEATEAPSEPAEPAEPTQPADSSDAGEPSNGSEPTGTSEPAEPSEPTEPAEPAGSEDVTETTETSETTETNETTETSDDESEPEPDSGTSEDEA